MSPLGLGTSALWGLEVGLFLVMYLCDVLVDSKTAQEAPMSPQDPPKRRPRGPKTPPRGAQEAPRPPQERPKRLQKEPQSYCEK